MNTAEFSKEYLPEWCERCKKQGVFFVDDLNATYYVVHQKCGHEAISVYCPKCEAGFALPIKASDQPASWDCPMCKTKYPLASNVFDSYINLYLEKDLPEAVRERVFPHKHRLASTIILVITAILLIVILYSMFN